MRVLHIATRHRLGGAERNVAHTIAWERAQGFEVHFAVGPDHLAAELPDGATIHVLPDLVRSVSPLRDLRALRQMRTLVRRHRFDVVHTHQSKAGVLGRLAARGRSPVILHTIHMASFGPAYNSVASLGFRLAERLCASWTTRIISVGRELAAMYRAAGIGRSDQYVLIRSPIDLTRFQHLRSRTAAGRIAAMGRFDLHPGVPVALVLASLERRKRVDLVLRELTPWVMADRIQVIIGGEGPERQNLEILARDSRIEDRVVFAGYREDVADAFMAADVLVHAATVEGVPQVVLQALAAGIPIAATRMVGLDEIEDAPIEIASDSAGSLLDAVERALAHPRASVPLARLKQWSPASVRKALAALYSTLPRVAP